MTKTWKELNKFSSTVAEMNQKNPKVMDTKFGYNIKRFEEINLAKPYKDYNHELALIRIEHCLVDKITKAILRDPTSQRGYQYDKEGMKAVLNAESDLEKEWEKKEFEVEPYLCKPENVPEELTETQKEVFAGLIIAEEKPAKEEKPEK